VEGWVGFIGVLFGCGSLGVDFLVSFFSFACVWAGWFAVCVVVCCLWLFLRLGVYFFFVGCCVGDGGLWRGFVCVMGCRVCVRFWGMVVSAVLLDR